MDSRAITAWMAAAMLIFQASLGLYGLSQRIRRESHIVLGLILLPLTFAHAWLSMKSAPMSANTSGLWLATVALLLLGVQLLLGTTLIRPSEKTVPLKKVHLAVGLGILFLAGTHVLLVKK